MDLTRAIRRLQLHVLHEDDDGDLLDILRDVVEGSDDNTLRAVMRHVYWRMPGVPTWVLTAVVGSAEEVRALAGRGPVLGSCTRCRRIVRASTRDTDLDCDPVRCDVCRRYADAPAPPPAVASRVAVRPTTPGTRFQWEFERTPTPWASTPVDVVLQQSARSWAEDYP